MDLREEEGTQRQKERCLTQGAEPGRSGTTKWPGKDQGMESREARGREGGAKDRRWRASRKSLGRAQKDFADAGENPALPGEAQPRD